MYVNDVHKLAFLHIPRTGGTTIKTMIGGFRRVTVDHHPCLRDVKDIEHYADYKLFSIVRDPYSRLASAYHRAFTKIMKVPRDDRRKVGERLVVSCLVYTKHLLANGVFLSQTNYLSYDTLRPEFFRYEDQSLSELASSLTGEKYDEIKTSDYGEYKRSDWLDSGSVSILSDYCSGDFELFGYVKHTFEELLLNNGQPDQKV